MQFPLKKRQKIKEPVRTLIMKTALFLASLNYYFAYRSKID